MSRAVSFHAESPPGGLRALSLQPSYRTEEHDLVGEFFVPCLSRSTRYDRTAGYFDTKAFELAADGIAPFVTNGGRIRLIVSPRLRRKDIAALTGTADWSHERAATVRASETPEADLVAWLRDNRYGCTSWLVHTGVLDVRVAFRAFESGIPFSHYHEKIGVFSDQTGDTVAFSGSINETGLAWHGNFESIDVFRDWERVDAPRVMDKTAAFDRLWRNETPGVVVRPIDEARKDGIGFRHLWNSVRTALTSHRWA